MKTLKEVAILVKKEFNKPKFSERYTGLCIVLITLRNHEIISSIEQNILTVEINKELEKRTHIYLYSLDSIATKKSLTNNNYNRAYVWKPFVKSSRNKFLNQIINS